MEMSSTRASWQATARFLEEMSHPKGKNTIVESIRIATTFGKYKGKE